MRLTTLDVFSPDLLLRYLCKFPQMYAEYVCVCLCVCVRVCVHMCKQRETSSMYG